MDKTHSFELCLRKRKHTRNGWFNCEHCHGLVTSMKHSRVVRALFLLGARILNPSLYSSVGTWLSFLFDLAPVNPHRSKRIVTRDHIFSLLLPRYASYLASSAARYIWYVTPDDRMGHLGTTHLAWDPSSSTARQWCGSRSAYTSFGKLI